jgi:predicted DNA-binding protein with PD1-like motif
MVPRRLKQPGPLRTQRWVSAEGPARTLAFSLEPGLTINEAIARPLAAAGMPGGTVELEGGALGPFTYVMPALSADPRYAAYYSQSYQPPGRTLLERASATFGTREGTPFIHCHGVWVEEDGSRRGGHVMPLDTTVLEPIQAKAFGTAAAVFAVLPDEETNFSLFTPVTLEAETAIGPRLILLKVQPNESMEDSVVAACQAHGIEEAEIHGVGSLVGPVFADGRFSASIATELFLGPSRVRMIPNAPAEVEMDVTLVDIDGVIHEGRLAPGNVVCIACELCVVEQPREAATLQERSSLESSPRHLS